MLHRSASSRRRRASRSAASPSSTSSPPQPRPSRSAASSPGRRASIAVSPVDNAECRRMPMHPVDRSPRHSIIPDISLEQEQRPNERLLPSPRHSLVPTDYARSPRNSLTPCDTPCANRSPRNSLTPELSKSRNSLLPDVSRSPRHSLTPEAYGSRLSLTPDFNRSARNSLVPRGSLTPTDTMDEFCRSPRHSIAPDVNSSRSPRGSIAPETLAFRTSPRGSIAGDHGSERERSPRGSIGPESENRSPRGSTRSTLNANSEEKERSPRGSLTLTFQEPPVSERRSSTDNPPGSRGRSTSPYRSRGSVNAGYCTNSVLNETGAAATAGTGGSRRASSSVSQVSGDEQRRLCADQKYGATENSATTGLGISLTTYGSVAYQLKDAHLEASGMCDFVCKALSIVNRTVVVTVILACLTTLPILMLIMGIQFLRDCPREPNIPIYMVVGGSVGCIKMALTLYNQLHTRRMDHVGSGNGSSIASKVASVALTVILIAWFALGNYWTLRIKWPDFAPTLFEPNQWCHRTLYIFALVHLCIVYCVIGALVFLSVTLAACQLFGCSWLGPTRYK